MEGNFGRRIVVTFTPTSWNQKKGVSQVDNQHSVVIAYDLKTKSELCSRIDFHVHSVGPSFMKTNRCATQIAKVDIWNIGSELNQMFDAYNNPDKNLDWKPLKIQQWCMDLKVGYDNGSFENIFSGIVSSFYVERVQNENNVDNIFHFVCWYPKIDAKTLGDNKGESGKDYLNVENRIALTSVESHKITIENYIKKIIMDRPREVSYVNQGKTFLNKISFALKNPIDAVVTGVKNIQGDLTAGDSLVAVETKTTLLGYAEDLISNPPVEKIDKYYTIKYDSEGTEVFFKTTLIWNQPCGDTSNLTQSLINFVKKFGYSLDMYRFPQTGLQVITISKAGQAVNTGKISGNKWEIINFQNLVKSPEVTMKNMNLTLLLEPGIKPFDTVTLKVTDDFMAQNRPSFSPSINPSAVTQFAGANTIGFAEFTKKENNVADQKGYGNIFNRVYNILCVDHQGSSHNNTWITKIECISTSGD